MRVEDLVLKANVDITLREKDRVKHHQSHNIMVNLGRNWLVTSIGESDYSSNPTTHPILFLKYIGFGVGGAKQQLDVDGVYPDISSAYPGTHVQDDDDPTVESLERPIAITDSGGGVPTWLKEVVYTPGPSSPFTYADFEAHFGETDLNIVPGHAFASVPLSEAALYLSDQDPTLDPYSGTRQVAAFYITFPTLSKSNQMELDIRWRIRT